MVNGKCNNYLTLSSCIELGALGDVEMVELDPHDPDQDVLARYRTVHPHGTVPALEIAGQPPVIESAAICLYLAHLYGLTVDAGQEAAYYNWAVYSVASLDSVMETLFQQWVHTDVRHQDTDSIDRAVRGFHAFCRHLTTTLDTRDFICGHRLSAADCVLGYNLWWASVMRDGALLNDFPVVRQYYSRLRRRSAFQRTFSET